MESWGFECLLLGSRVLNFKLKVFEFPVRDGIVMVHSKGQEDDNK